MKKFLSLLLTTALVLSTLAGCGGDSSSSSGSVSSSGSGAQSAPDPGSASSDSYQLPNLTVLSGPTGVGAAKLMADADAVTEEDVMRVARDILRPERMNVMVLGKAGRAVRKTEISDLGF